MIHKDCTTDAHERMQIQIAKIDLDYAKLRIGMNALEAAILELKQEEAKATTPQQVTFNDDDTVNSALCPVCGNWTELEGK